MADAGRLLFSSACRPVVSILPERACERGLQRRQDVVEQGVFAGQDHGAETQRRLIVARADVNRCALSHGPIHQGTWLQPAGSSFPV